jgi:hypothetical protein
MSHIIRCRDLRHTTKCNHEVTKGDSKPLAKSPEQKAAGPFALFGALARNRELLGVLLAGDFAAAERLREVCRTDAERQLTRAYARAPPARLICRGRLAVLCGRH